MRIRVAWLFAIPLLFISCFKSSGWEYDHISSDSKLYDSAKLCYSNTDNFPPYSFEILKVNQQLYGNFSLMTGKIKSTSFTLTIDNHKFEREGILHKGGQKIFIPNDILNLIIAALNAGKGVVAELGDIKIILKSEDFLKQYQKLMHKNPFYEKVLEEIQQRIH